MSEAKALIYMALWINMSGPPTTLLTWLGGRSVTMKRQVPAPSIVVDVPTIENYLRATPYFTSNPSNFPHMQQCVAAGARLLA
jgi:hypothetical protein